MRHLILLAALLSCPAEAQGIGLPPPHFPPENPPVPEKALLGKFLFWEEQMSGDNTMACGTCHVPEMGGSDPRSFEEDSVHPGFDGVFGTEDDVRGSKGVVSFDEETDAFAWESVFFPGHQVTGRKAPTAINAALFSSSGNDVGLFWDGRADTAFVDPQTGQLAIASGGALESQAVAPPVSAAEMGGIGATWENIVAKLQEVTPLALASDLPSDMSAFLDQHPTYPDMFNAVFGTPDIDAKRIAFAIADYERTLISDQTPFDLHFSGVQDLPAELQPGLNLFMSTCHVCHIAPMTFDWTFHNLGVRPDHEDEGLAAVTGDPDDVGKFKTAQLRNVALRLPVFHNGSAETLEEVVDFYDGGGGFDSGHKDPILVPLGLTAQQKHDLVLFLEEALTDPRVVAGEAPFDRPTLASEAGAGSVTFGTATPSGEGVEPKVLAHVPANVGHDEYMLGVYDAAPDSVAFLAAGTTSAPDQVIAGVSFNVDVGSIFLTAGTPTDDTGVGTIDSPIPPSPALSGVVLYGNWIVVDATAPTGLASTQGVTIPLL